jgi:crotonobetainyl-CoA:carnitine CoA-transferase CaiB-like acyl-CoA transferase
MPGALEGVRIADFSRVLAGPYATMLLADLGADVVKVERPGTGDDTREWGPPFDAGGASTYFLSVNRNKRSVAIDLSTDKGRGAARALALVSDVLVENFKPGTLGRMGLGFDDLHAEHPGLVVCSITGFGDAEGRELPGYDLVLQAVGGLMSVTGPESGAPTKVGVALVDVIAGLHAALGILAALRHRDRTGEGQRVQISLLSSLLSGLVNQASGYVSAGVVPGILGNAHPSIAPYEVYQVADGHFVVAVGNDRQFAALCAVLERPDLAEDARFLTNADRVRNRADLNRELAPALSTRAGSQWFDALRAVGVPCGPINDLAGAFAFAESLGLDPIVEIDGPAGAAASRQVRNPIGMSATPPRYASAPPSLGRDTDAVLRDLGLPHDEPS